MYLINIVRPLKTTGEKQDKCILSNYEDHCCLDVVIPANICLSRAAASKLSYHTPRRINRCSNQSFRGNCNNLGLLVNNVS